MLITQSKKVKGYKIAEQLGVVFVRVKDSEEPAKALEDIKKAAGKMGADAVVRLKHTAAVASAHDHFNSENTHYTTFLGTAVKLAPKTPSNG